MDHFVFPLALAAPDPPSYTRLMNISSVSMDTAQSSLQNQVGTVMLARGLRAEQEQASDLLKGLPSAAPLPEGSGQRVDLFV